jgi:aspartate kinase
MSKSASICLGQKPLVVVLSAAAGVTNLLIEISTKAIDSHRSLISDLVAQIKSKHDPIIRNLTLGQSDEALLESLYRDLEEKLMLINSEKILSQESLDYVLSFGEKISSILFCVLLTQMRIDKKIQLLSSEEIIKTDSNFGAATPNTEDIKRIANELIHYDEKTLYVMQGFIGSDHLMRTTTLGRGGSDFTAALMAEALNASILEIWTDVPGVFTSDPNKDASAQKLPLLNYSQAIKMAKNGAKVLHPETMTPALRLSIPIYVGSTFQPEVLGTWIRN